MKHRYLAAFLSLLAVPAFAQSVQQSGTVTPGHATRWISNGVVGDAGTAASGSLTSMGVTNNGGPGVCVNSATPTSPGYNQICLSATTNGGSKISSYAFGTATNAGIVFDVNGSVQGFPVVSLPVSAGGATCFLNTSGTLKDCGFDPLPATLTAAHIFVGNASNVATDTAVTGDASITNAGVWTNLKVNGVAYPASPGTATVPVVTGTNQITYESVPAGALSLTNGKLYIGGGSNLAAEQSISGDASVTNGGAWTNSKVNGVAYPTSPGLNTVPVVTGTNQITYGLVPIAAIPLGTAGYALMGNGASASSFQGFTQSGGGTAQTWPDKVGQTINTKDYGVVCDGVTDDTVNLQKALDYAHTSPVSTTINVQAGNCITSATLQMYSNTWLVGGGFWASRITRTGNFGDTITMGTLLPGGAVANVKVKGIWFQHSTDYVTADLVTNGTTASGNATLHFASVPASITAGMAAFDVTTGVAIGGTVSSTTSTTVVMSTTVGTSVGSGDTISFGQTNLPNFVGGSGAAHLRIRGANVAVVEESAFHRLPYSVVFEGGSIITFRGNVTQGVWDNVNAGVQEGVAGVFFSASTSLGNPTSVNWENNNIFGTSSMQRNVTYTASDASLTLVKRQNIGPKYGLYSDGTEDITIHAGLIGGMNAYGIFFENHASYGAIIDARISQVHFDGSNLCDITFQTLDTSKYTLGAEITGNVFNGEQSALHGICTSNTNGVSTYGLNITGNSFFAHIASPILLTGSVGSTIGPNTITNYNSYNVSATDYDFVAAAHAYGSSAKLQFNDNVVGGGGNNFADSGGPGNYTYYGIIATGTGVTQTGTIDAGLLNPQTVQTLSTAQATVTDTTASTSGTTGSLTVGGGIGSNGAINATGRIGASGGFYVGANLLAQASGNYHVVYEPAGNPALYLGNATDPSNYLDNTQTCARPRGGGAVSFGCFSSSGLTLGTAGTYAGVLTLKGLTSGQAVIAVPSAAGTPTLTLGSSSGTPAVTASSPLAISTTTGDVSCATCITPSSIATFTNKTFDTAGTGNSFSINSVAVTANTGTGAIARAVSPAFTTPNLGTPSAATLTSATGLPISTGVSGLGTGIATFLGTPSSANLAAAVTDETGSGALVFATSPTFVTPTLGAATATSLTSPSVIGGTGAASVLTLKSTSGVGTTDSILFLVGNNGGTTGGGIGSNGFWTIGNAGATPDSLVTIMGNTTASVAPPATTYLHIVGADSSLPRIVMDAYNGVAIFNGRRANGTLASKTAIANNDLLFAYDAQGWDGATYADSTSINMVATGNWTGSSHPAETQFYTVASGSTSQTLGMVHKGSGGLSIGSSTSADPGAGGLQLNGQQFSPNMASDTATTDSTVCTATSGGKLLKGTGALGICLGTSGRQFKTDFVPMQAGLAEIAKINLLNYRYRPGYGDDGNSVQYGLTAQDVEAVLPDLARHDAKGETINYDSGALFFIGLRAIQQLKAENDNLKARLTRLESR